MGILNSQSHFEIGSDVEEVIVSEYGRHLEGEYVRSRLRVKALGMAEASVDAPAGVAGESGMSITNIEGTGSDCILIRNVQRFFDRFDTV